MFYENSLRQRSGYASYMNISILDEILEVRERIIEDKPLVINNEGNWNNKNPVVKEEYLFNYMAKNLYILECLAASEYEFRLNITSN